MLAGHPARVEAAAGRLVCVEGVRVNVGKLRGMREQGRKTNVRTNRVNGWCTKHSRTACVQKWYEICGTSHVRRWLWKVPRCESGRGEAHGVVLMRVTSARIPQYKRWACPTDRVPYGKSMERQCKHLDLLPGDRCAAEHLRRRG